MTRRPPRSALWLLCAAHFVCVLDLTVVNGVLEPLGHDLGASRASQQWVIGAYAIAFGGFLLVGGRAADLLGPRRTFAWGTVGFALASLAAAAAPGIAPLVAARAGQGLSAALVEPAAVALLAQLHPAGSERTRALALWGSVGGLGAVSGLLIGGAATEVLDWRAVFLGGALLGPIGLVLAPRLLPSARPVRGQRVDLVGAALLTAACTGLALLLVGLADRGLAAVPAIGALAAVASGVAFAVRHARTRHPLVPHGFLGRSGVGLPAAVGCVQGAIMLGTLFLLMITFVEVMGMEPIQAGVAMLGMRATQAGWARFAGQLIDRVGARRAQLIGLTAMASGCAWLASLPDRPSYAADVLPGLLLLGLAAPLVFVSGSTLALQCVRPADSGLASGILGSSQWLGGSLGVAAVSALLVAHGDGDGARHGFGLLAALAAVTVVGSWLVTRNRPLACPVPAVGVGDDRP